MKQKIDVNFALNQEPKEAVKYFEEKGYKISWDWRDTYKEANAKAFTVAKMTDMDLLQDTKKMLNTALKEGWTEREFQLKASEMYRKKGWWGQQDVLNPKTGKMETVQLGSPYRLRTIFNTNMQSAYMSGRYKTQLLNADKMGYLEYICLMNERSRASHKALNGIILPIDDPFWNANYAPNDFNCKCRIRAVDKGYAAKKGISDSTRLRSAASEGWDYNPGKAWFQPDLNKYDYKIAKDYCIGVVTGSPFEYFFNTTKKKTAQEVLSSPQSLPIAVINNQNRTALQAKTQVVKLSNQTLKKQFEHHQDISLELYKKLPDVVDNAQLIVDLKGEKLVCIEHDKNYLLAVIKATKNKKELFISSFRMTNLKDVKREAKKGKIIKNELYKQ